MWTHCSLTPWTSQNWRESSSLPQGAFNTLDSRFQNPEGYRREKTLFFSASSSSLSSNSYWCDGQTWLHGKKAGGIWQLWPLAQQKGLQLVSVRACLQKWISWYPYRHTRTRAKMNEMLVLRPHWELIGGGRLFLNSVIETPLGSIAQAWHRLRSFSEPMVTQSKR